MALPHVILLLALAPVMQPAERDAATARKLLDGAVEMSSSVHPETGVTALLRAGITYAALDKKTSLALLNRAFSAVPSLPTEELRDEYGSLIVAAAAELDSQAASELLRQLPKPASAATAVVRQLLSEKHVDQVMELLVLLPEQVEYPYEAASYLIAQLPPDDTRRAISFGRATAAFARLPSGPFPLMVERFGKQMPGALRDRAVSVMLERIAAWKDSNESFTGSANEDDPNIEIHSPQQNELRELVSVVRLYDPSAVDRIISQRPDIATALAGFRRPRKAAEPIANDSVKKDAKDDDPFSPPFGIGMAGDFESFRRNIDEYGKAAKQAEKVNEALKKDPAEAVRLARTLPDMIRAEALAVIAASVVTKDPTLATSVVDSCINELQRMDNPGGRIPTLIKLGGIYARMKDPARAHSAYERALADAVPLWSKDTKADRPNVASRDTWPSTQAVRATVHDAALHLGAQAESLLSGMTVPDLAVLARIQMARGLLGLPIDIHNINVRWVDQGKQ